MYMISTVRELRAQVADWRRAGERIALVPTMGNLHAGHIHLVEQARARAERSIASIFVNPTQFGPSEDYLDYPRTLEKDSRKLEQAELDLLFAPAVAEVYPRPLETMTRVEVPVLSGMLCGEWRPGHFQGVATVVTKLLNMTQPDVALFGEKDWQQLVIIRRLAEDLDVPVEIVGVPTVREADGLAISSRNGYLTLAERALAPRLFQLLATIAQRLAGGERDYPSLQAEAMAELTRLGFHPEYVEVRRAADLMPPGPGDRELRILAAARLGKARLIDNCPMRLMA